MTNPAELPPPLCYRSAWWRRLPLVRQILAHRWHASLLTAVGKGDADGVENAIRHGANPRLPMKSLAFPSKPTSLIVMAVESSNALVVDALLRGGACANEKSLDRFALPPLATAVLRRDWEKAQQLLDAGASWETPIDVIHPEGWAQGQFANGSIDPSLMGSVQTTLRELVLGKQVSLRDTWKDRGPLHADPNAHSLLAQWEAKQRGERLEMAWAGVPSVTAPPARTRL